MNPSRFNIWGDMMILTIGQFTIKIGNIDWLAGGTWDIEIEGKIGGLQTRTYFSYMPESEEPLRLSFSTKKEKEDDTNKSAIE